MDAVRFEDFQRLELRTAKVLEARPHPAADRLYLLRIDGGGEERQIVAGIRRHYTPEDLVGRTIIVVWNLEPAVIRGEESRGMLLAVADGDTVAVLRPDREVRAGQRVS
jgi:methionyl-tRNA synthetase